MINRIIKLLTRLFLIKLLILSLISCDSNIGTVADLDNLNANIPQSPNFPVLKVKSSTAIELNWSGVIYANFYQVYRNTEDDKEKADDIESVVVAKEYFDSKLKAGTEYFYWLKACKSPDECSDFSLNSKATTLVIPNTPSSPFLTSSKSTSVDLSWLVVAGADYYQLYRNISDDQKNASLIGEKVAQTNYSDIGLQANSKYYYWLKACNEAGECSETSSRFHASTLVLPSPPGAPILSLANSSTINLSWSVSANTDHYLLYRNTSDDSNTANIVSSNLRSTNHSDTGLTAGVTYYYWLKSCNIAEECSDFSHSAHATPVIILPPTPQPATLSVESSTTINLSWSQVLGADYYQVFRNTIDNTNNATKIKESSNLSFSDNSLIANTSYYYWLKACNSSNECSLFSSSSTATTLAIPAPPNAPVLNVVGNSAIELNWQTVTFAHYYQIFRNTSDNFSFATLISSSVQTISYKESTTLNKNTDYYYWLKSCNIKDECSDFSQSSSAKTTNISFRLNDTGIFWDGNTSGNNNDCNSSNISENQDCDVGRDAKFLANSLTKTGSGAVGFDFTKLDASGVDLSLQNKSWNNAGSEAQGTKWSCVRDNHTGLVWEVKIDDGGVHDNSKTYDWGGVTAIGKTHDAKQGDYFDDWDVLVNAANQNNYGSATGLCGFTDWRVPDLLELSTIVNKGVSNPAVDTHYFPNTVANSYWTAMPKIYTSGTTWYFKALSLNFKYGTDSISTRTTGYRLRLVRGGIEAYAQSYPVATSGAGQTVLNYIPNIWHESRYTVHNNGTVTDTYTDLMWQVCSEGQSWVSAAVATCNDSTTTHTWQQALQVADSSSFASYSDWRLPNIEELRSLVAFDRFDPSINLDIFPSSSTSSYWSSSPYAYDGTKSLFIYFDDGDDGSGSRTVKRRVRLVRGGI